MKHENVDWSRWPEAPSKEVYEDWLAARKEKHRVSINQTAINRMAMHIQRLVREDICSVDLAVSIAAENGWRGIKYAWVIVAINRDMDGYTAPKKDTRSLSLQDMFTNDWAEDLTNRLN